ncbi:MAG: peptide chain release factor N(5)-glutamine methyltransferase [Oscillospiraceae bacterium]|nr:peptide chain release factor N(5)-glutamine methyltransferase [Oscillospiraceae bacterium]
MPKTYNALYLSLRQKLREAGIEAFSLEARLLVACAARRSPEKLLQDLQLYASDEIEARVTALGARRLAGEPVAYITERWSFYGLELKVTPDVLIPRSDTEVLAEQAISLLRGRTEAARVLDLCTGSGCVGCAIAHALPQSRVVLLDHSPAALAVAAENVETLGLSGRVQCIQADVTQPPPPMLGSFDLIVANPPYIRSAEIETLDASVRDYEPRAALDGGADGLDFYRAILRGYLALLRRPGQLALEVGEDQAGDVSLLLRRAGLLGVGSAQDTAGYARVVFGKLS